MTVEYNPYDYAIHEDPYPTYARLRAEAPLYRNEEKDFWAFSRHADVAAGFRDSETYSNSHGVSLDPAASGPHAHQTMSFLAMDPPRHTRMRALVSKGFTPRRVAQSVVAMLMPAFDMQYSLRAGVAMTAEMDEMLTMQQSVSESACFCSIIHLAASWVRKWGPLRLMAMTQS